MVSKKLCVKAAHVSFLKKNFFDGGNVLFCGTENIRVRGAGSCKYKNGNYKVTPDMMLSITSFVNDEHSEGKCVTARKINSHLYSKYHLEIHRTTVGHVVAKLGLSWAPASVLSNSTKKNIMFGAGLRQLGWGSVPL